MTEGMSVSGCKPVFSPKPPPQQQSRAESLQAEQHVSAPQGSAVLRRKESTVTDMSKEAAVITSTTEARPRRKILPVDGLELDRKRHKQRSLVRQVDSSMTTTATKEGGIPVAILGRGAGVDVGGASSVGFDLSARPSEQLLTRSGSAPSSSAMTLTSASADRRGLPACQASELRTSALVERRTCASESKAELGRTRRDCWDESGKTTILPTDAAKAPPDSARSTTSGNATDVPTMSEGETNERLLQQLVFRGKFRRSIAWKRPQSGSRESCKNDEKKSHFDCFQGRVWASHTASAKKSRMLIPGLCTFRVECADVDVLC